MEKFCYWSLKPIISKWFLCYCEITSAMTTASSSKNTSSLFYCYLQQASNEAKLSNGKKIKREDNNLYYWNTCAQLASKVDLSITAATVPALLWTGWQTTGLSMCCSMTCINLENNLLLYQTEHYGWVARYQSINCVVPAYSCIYQPEERDIPQHILAALCHQSTTLKIGKNYLPHGHKVVAIGTIISSYILWQKKSGYKERAN